MNDLENYLKSNNIDFTIDKTNNQYLISFVDRSQLVGARTRAYYDKDGRWQIWMIKNRYVRSFHTREEAESFINLIERKP